MSRSNLALAVLLFNFCYVLDAAVAYAGVTIDGSVKQLKTPPSALAIKVTASAGNYAGGNVNATLHTSHDGATWFTTPATLNFTADATKELQINTPIMRYVRVTYTTGGSATIKTELYCDVDADPASGVINETAGDAIGGLRPCYSSVIFDSLAPVAATGGGAEEALQGVNVCAAFMVLTVTGRTAGTIDAKVQQLPTGSAVWEDTGDAFAQINANGTTILAIAKRVGAKMRLHYTVGGGFDGKVSSTMFHDGVWSA